MIFTKYKNIIEIERKYFFLNNYFFARSENEKTS